MSVSEAIINSFFAKIYHNITAFFQNLTIFIDFFQIICYDILVKGGVA